MANRFKAPIQFGVDTAQLLSLMARLKDLDPKAGKPAVKRGVNEITRLVLWAAREGVPKRTGMLRKSLGRKVIVQRGGAKVLGVVKPRGGEKYSRVVNGKKVSPIRYAHFVEFGRVFVRVKNKKALVASAPGPGGTNYVVFGKQVRAVPPRPFLRPAWEKHEPRAVPILHEWLHKAVQDYWKRTRTRRAKRGK